MSRFNEATVKHLKKPGRYADGDGLYLNVTRTGTKSWLVRYSINGRRREVGLGSYPKVGLAEARQRASERRAAAKWRSAPPTFAEAAARVHALNRARWSSEHHANFWLRSLELHAAGLWNMRLNAIRPVDVIACLEPQWTTKSETMRRVRQRIQTVMRWGMAHGYIKANPAGEIITAALPPQPRVQQHRRAVHYLDVPAVLAVLRSSQASSAVKCCMEFLVLTAARSGEARLATWKEVDASAGMWTVPAKRMKRRIAHRVPLSGRALEVLEDAKSLHDGSGYLFPSPLRPGHPLPPETLLKSLRDHNIDATVHGFRSTFKTWAIECSDASWAVTEAALAHRIGDQTEASYVRGDLFEKRRALMEQWAEHLRSTPPPQRELWE